MIIEDACIRWTIVNAVKMEVFTLLVVAAAGACLHLSLGVTASTFRFQDLTEIIEEKRLELSQHKFFKYLADSSIPASKRVQFIPYWSYFAIGVADVAECLMRIPNPQTELEHRVNIVIDEEGFHYNFFFHDVEKVTSYSIDRYGSYEGVLRHIWGHDSKAVRMLIYTWALAFNKRNDPLLSLATLEAIEAGLTDFMEAVYNNLFLAENGYTDLKYFGRLHMELERNHTFIGRYTHLLNKQDLSNFRPLKDYEVNDDLKVVALEAIEDMFYWFHQVYDSLYNICMAEDTIRPDKYNVKRYSFIHEGYPYLYEFPPQHPNRNLISTHGEVSKDEL